MHWINGAWATSLRHEHRYKRMPVGVFNVRLRQLIRHLVDQPDNRTIVMVHRDDPEIFFGFICGGPALRSKLAVHYAATKDVLRRQGICHTLFDALISDSTHSELVATETTRAWNRTPRGRGMRYDPFVLMEHMLDA